ncbi:MAG: sugar phosphorylase [Acidobacteriota bacterium]
MSTPASLFASKLEGHLTRLYPDEDVAALVTEIVTRVERLGPPSNEPAEKWSQNDVALITYGDSVTVDGESPLVTLRNLLQSHLEDTVSAVHVLPFYPYSSDDGFSVIDFVAVDPRLGDWEDVRDLAGQTKLMADLVINHVSSQSAWFQQFLADEVPGRDYFIALDPETDVSEVIRPRSHPLLVPFETAAGRRSVWATFSEDQIDLDFSNPAVLLEMIRVVVFYLEQGVQWLRLDAVGFLWKVVGTPCIHHELTHEVVRLLRTVAEAINPHAVLITETNVPALENLTYFGNRNEAHAIYNFSLPPLLIDALIQGRSKHLRAWLMSMPPAPYGCAYFNFTASHDGIGLRPTEGLLSSEDIDQFIETLRGFGAEVSMRTDGTGRESPYEVNISLFDALKGTVRGEDEFQVERFLCSQIVMLGLEGIPAVYIHSLLATPNDHDQVRATGRKRSINRHRWSLERLEEELADPASDSARVLAALQRVLRIRRRQPAFHPDATQYTLQLGESLFGVWRQSVRREQSIFAVHNLTRTKRSLDLSKLNLLATDEWFDLIDGARLTSLQDELELSPYQCVWLTNYEA